MNLSLLDPFQNDFPEVIEEYFEHGITKCIAFNRRGTLLAAGCLDGACIIWDFDTRGIAKELRDKDCSAPITSVSWSKCGHRLLTAATDKSLSLWDVGEGIKIEVTSLQQTALHARLHPASRLPTSCLACPMSSAPVWKDFTSGATYVLPVSASKASEAAHNSRAKPSDGNFMYSPAAASFNKRGDLIYVGNSKGEILIIDTASRQVHALLQIPGGAVIRQIVFSRNGQYLLTNSNDRVIRVFENLLPQDGAAATLADIAASSGGGNSIDDLRCRGSKCLSLAKEFQDAVNRMHWKAACFNGDGEFIVGASASKGEHKIHIWNRNGQLVKILEGPKEGLTDLAWHPTRPIVASVSMSGVVYLWAKDYTENWSAFAPDFKELEENEEYVEREDEFDIMPDTDKAKPTRVDEDIEVDIMGREKVAAFSDSDESEDGLHFLPTVPLPDTPEQQNPSAQSSDGPCKPQSSSHIESDRSPAPEDDDKRKLLSEPNHFHAVDSFTENGTGSEDHGRRKRMLSEKVDEYDAEKHRKVIPKGQTSISRQRNENNNQDDSLLHPSMKCKSYGDQETDEFDDESDE